MSLEKKPELKPGEYLCDGCWKVADHRATQIGQWMFIKFKHLKDIWLCGECQKTKGEEMIFKQQKGL